jgi:hypothetical protein
VRNSDAVARTEQRRDDYSQAIDLHGYWDEVYWSGNRQISGTEDDIIDLDSSEDEPDVQDQDVIQEDKLFVETSTLEWFAMTFMAFGGFLFECLFICSKW